MNTSLAPLTLSSSREWLEADGLGGFASGTSAGIRTRRYHALLLPATTPPTGRVVLVNGFDAWVETANGTFSLSSQRYSPDVIGGDGAQRIEGFGWEPWPHWIFKLDDGTRIEHELFVPKGEPMTCLSWRVLGPGRSDVKLFVRPFLSGRDYHSLHKGNPAFRFDAELKPDRVSWQPYPGLPGVTAGVPGVTVITNGSYSHEPHWYYNFLYEEERNRGLDCEEDLAAPGVFEWNLAESKAALVLTTKEYASANLSVGVKPLELLNERRDREQKRREKSPSRLHAAADAYIVERRALPPRPALAPNGGYVFSTMVGMARCAVPARVVAGGTNIRPTLAIERVAPLHAARTSQRDVPTTLKRYNGGEGARRAGEEVASEAQAPLKTIIAGYPWFTDWGRDTFIALRGLCLATGRFDVARDILLAWASVVSVGMLPIRFSDDCEQPEFNAVDASLWYVIAVHEYLQANKIDGGEKKALLGAVEAILDGYSKGTRYGIRATSDGLLAGGVAGVQLTWMDAKVGDWVVTPRTGKPVEVQALWLNALKIGSQFNAKWTPVFEHGLASFRERFWNEAGGYLYDVVDCNHLPGVVDATFRPNQILAVGGLPFSLLQDEQALCVVVAVEARLWVPMGLRSLAPGEPGYTPHYIGGVRERDGAYHQGTVWPWLIGPFVEAWVRVRGNTNEAKREARGKFLTPFLAHLEEGGLGHISEIAEAEPPHAPRGCPFQAWSVGEALRLDRVVLAETTAPRSRESVRKRSRELVPA